MIVVGAAWEEDGGVRGELSALLPERTMRAIQESVSPEEEEEEDEAEPWAASATLGGTSYEEAVGSDEDDEEDEDEEDDDAEPHFPLVIGAVIRFPENRRFPTDFELEVDDLMRPSSKGAPWTPPTSESTTCSAGSSERTRAPLLNRNSICGSRLAHLMTRSVTPAAEFLAAASGTKLSLSKVERNQSLAWLRNRRRASPARRR